MDNIQITMVAVADLVPYANNSRTHSDEQVAQIAASIKEFGFTNPILTDGENGIIAGHGRLMGARKLGLTEVPTIELSHLSEKQRRAYIIADNKLALNAGWDLEVLQLELGELRDEGFDLSLTGFGDDELGAMFVEENEGLTDADAVPELQDTVITKPGDLWLLDKHRLLCGDSTVATDVAAVLGDISPLLMVTDPPYGVEYDADWRNKAQRKDGTPLGAGATGVVTNDDRADWGEAWVLFPGDAAYVWHGGLHSGEVQKSLEDSGFLMRCQIVWAKSRFAISRGHYHWQHEPCWYAVRKGGKGHWNGDRSQSTLWEISHNKSETGHSTQKPIECMKRPIENNSSPGQAVYDPFLGSGTTLIAAEMTGRQCLGLEIAPNYCDVIIRRWQDFAGKEAIHESTGKTFGTIKDG